MRWEPISEEALWSLLSQAESRMAPRIAKFWETIRIAPEKWAQHPYGDEGEGFWAVAVLGTTVVWYNDIEEGFNRSSYKCHGTIDDYWCNQDELEWILTYLLNAIETGHDSGPFSGPPEEC
jgi:hypothetical protein